MENRAAPPLEDDVLWSMPDEKREGAEHAGEPIPINAVEDRDRRRIGEPGEACTYAMPPWIEPRRQQLAHQDDRHIM